MPIFCNYGEVEVAAQETGQFKLSKIKLDGESPRKWYKSSVSTFWKNTIFGKKRSKIAKFFRGDFFFGFCARVNHVAQLAGFKLYSDIFWNFQIFDNFFTILFSVKNDAYKQFLCA